MSRLRPDLYYGWFVVAGTFAVSFISVGIGFYGQGVFLDGLIREHGWSKESVSGASTSYFITVGVVGLLVGRAVDRWGSRGPIVVGAILMATALLFLGHIDEPRELYAVYTLLAASFSMTAAIPLSSLVNRWFVRQRARALSISQTGVSLGGLVLLPVATSLIAERGLEIATIGLAALVLAINIPIAIWVLREDPHDHGLTLDGDVEVTPISKRDAEMPPWRARDALRNPTFMALAVSFAAIILCQTGLSVHHLHLLREHLDTSAAAFGAATVPLGSIIGRLISGRIVDRTDKRLVAVVAFATQATAILALSFASRTVALLGASLLFGFTIGTIFMLQALLVAEFFGIASFGTLFGLLNLISSFGGGLGPLTLGVLAERLGGYPSALRVLVAIALFAALLIARIRPPDVTGTAFVPRNLSPDPGPSS